MGIVSGLAAESGKRANGNLADLSESQRALVFNFNVLDRTQSVPEAKAAGYDDSDQKADAEEQPIARKRDQKDNYDRDSCDERRRAAQAETEAGCRHLEIILSRRVDA